MPGPCARRSNFEYDFPDQESMESDASFYNRPKDPPGQRSHYIQSGNQETEVYRITTFNKFPNHVPIDPMMLAKYGFLFTGYKDRVKCFSCCLCVQDWSAGDNPRSSKWHFQDCPLVNGTETRNVQIAKLVRKPLQFVMEGSDSGVASDSGFGSFDSNPYSNALATQSSLQPNGDVTNITSGLSGVKLGDSNDQKPYQTAQVTVKLGPYVIAGLEVARINNESFKKILTTLDLVTEEGRRKSFQLAIEPNEHFKSLNHNMIAKSGFFYLGDLDRTQCFSCSGTLRNWRVTDAADNEHKRHYPNCKLMNNNEPRNVAILELGSPPDPSPEEQQRLNDLFPCLSPITRSMSSYENRLKSFNSNWDRNKIKAPIQLIAQAGFFYLGNRDRAKCFYCNGGLQNWDPDDEPWTEHAKWFPGCEFILRSKGIEFAREMFVKHQGMQRLKIRNERREYHPDFQTQSNQTPATCARSVVGRQVQSAGAVLLQGMAPNHARMPQAAADLVPNHPHVVPAANLLQQNVNQLQTNVNQIEKFRDQAKGMGFTDNQINQVIQNRGTNGVGNFEQMVEELIAVQPVSANIENANVEMTNVPETPSNEGTVSTNQQPQVNTAPKRNISTPPVENDQNKRVKKDEAISQELLDLEKERLCKKCTSSPADAVLIPCGHLSFCSSCVKTGGRCHLCKRKIDQVIKVFVA